MSHMVRVATQIKNRDNLVEALTRMGFARNKIKVTDQAHKIHDYYGKANVDAHVSIAKGAGSRCSDIGWESREDGTMQFHYDGMDHTFNTTWQNKLMQTYSEVTVEQTAGMMGFSMAQRDVSNNGDIKLILRKW